MIAAHEKFWGNAGPNTVLAFEAVAGAYLDAGRFEAADPYVREGLRRLPTDVVLRRDARQIAWARANAPTTTPTTTPPTE